MFSKIVLLEYHAPVNKKPIDSSYQAINKSKGPLNKTNAITYITAYKGKNKMLVFQNKSKSVTIALVILLISSIIACSISTQVSAHNPPQNIKTLSFLNVAPNPIGVGQTVTVNFWLNQPPPTANGVYGDRWDNLTVVVTNPNGTKQTLGPFSSDATGGTFALYTPTQVGNYTFQFFFPGQTLAGKNLIPGASPQVTQFIGDYYQPSNSTVVTLTVQQEPIQGFPQNPLPTSYWD